MSDSAARTSLLGKLTKFAIVLLPCFERGLGSVTLGKRTCKTWPQAKGGEHGIGFGTVVAGSAGRRACRVGSL